MNQIRITQLLVFLIFQFAATAQALTFSECNALAAKLNKQFPSRVDSSTTVLSTRCEGINPIYLVYEMKVDAPSSRFTASHATSLRNGQIDSWCSTSDLLKLLKLVGIRYVYTNSSSRQIGETSFTINDCKPLNLPPFSSKYDTKNHPKAKGIWATVRYPQGWVAKEGERPNIVQKFTGDYKGLFVMLALQITDAGAPVEKECAETSASAFGRDMVDGEDNLKILKIKKIKHEEKPAYMYDLQSNIERAGLATSTTSRVMSVCYKNTLVSAWCSPMKIDTKNTLIQSNQNDLESINNLCFQFFNSLVLMDKY